MHGGAALEGDVLGRRLRTYWIDLLPFGAAAVLALVLLVTQPRWVPMGDEAAMLMRSKDVFSAHPPLFGVYSTRGFVHPGPAPFVITQIASGFGLGPGRGTFVGMMLLNGALGSLAVWVSGRCGPPAFHRAVALMTLGAMAALGGRGLASFWNPFSAVMWFVLALVCALSLSFGRSQAAPLVGVAAGVTVAAQSHVAFGVIGALVAALSVGWVMKDSRGQPWRTRLRPLLSAGVAVALLWIPPVIAQLRGQHNLSRLFDYFGGGRSDAGMSAAMSLRLSSLAGCPVCDVATSRYRTNLGGVVGHPWPIYFVALAGVLTLAWIMRGERVPYRAAQLAAVLLIASPVLAHELYGFVFQYLLTWLIPVWFAVWLAAVLFVMDRTTPRPAVQAGAVWIAAAGLLISATPQIELPNQRYAPTVEVAASKLLADTHGAHLTIDYLEDPMGVALPGVIDQVLRADPDARTGDADESLKWGWRRVPTEEDPNTKVLLAVRYRDDDWSDLNRCVVESGREIVRANSLSAAESTRLFELNIRRLDRSRSMPQRAIDELEGLAARAVEIVAVQPTGPVQCSVLSPGRLPR